ncbi:hypothetical protein [Desulfoscipio sp. XC116]|uniref:hypothetical protein n=1 Tax=Desulfoscipio sp. XC116 TaxID=3144975 RepID=UPI00325A8C8F
MILKRTVSSEFIKCFNETIILDEDIEIKLNNKHKVYKEDLSDALGDSYLVVLKPKQTSPAPKGKSKGKVFEILGETEEGRVLFIIGRLFSDGNLYIITAYWADSALEKIYRQESKVLRENE